MFVGGFHNSVYENSALETGEIVDNTKMLSHSLMLAKGNRCMQR